MAFGTGGYNAVMERAAKEAERLGLGRYLIIVQEGERIHTVSDEAELRAAMDRGARYLGVTADAKGGC